METNTEKSGFARLKKDNSLWSYTSYENQESVKVELIRGDKPDALKDYSIQKTEFEKQYTVLNRDECIKLKLVPDYESISFFDQEMLTEMENMTDEDHEKIRKLAERMANENKNGN